MSDDDEFERYLKLLHDEMIREMKEFYRPRVAQWAARITGSPVCAQEAAEEAG